MNRKLYQLLLCCFLFSSYAFGQTLPTGFASVNHASGFDYAVGFTFDNSGRMFVWEKAGRVWAVVSGVKAATPMIDIQEEVNSLEGDLGLLGMALDPGFLQNGYVYLSYVVDRHHLLFFGTPNYNPNTSEIGATIVRITRFTVDPTTLTYIGNSRKVLIGESKSTGIPSLYNSHTGGGIVFGSDGTLLVATGDGASATVPDYGGEPSTYYQQALDDGIIEGAGNPDLGNVNKHHENIGAYRAQNMYSLCGKLLRIDPNTGDGIPSNPFYDGANPRSTQSRIYSLGLRNPFRISRREGTGSLDPADSNPGAIYIGNVGWNRFEEVNVVKSPGENFGWPLYEGINTRIEVYSPLNEPVYPPYRVYPLPDPNSPPKIAISPNDVRILQHGTSQLIPRNTNLPYADVTKGSTCIIDGGWSSASSGYPAEYKNRYFFASYSPTASWIAYAQFDTDDNPLEIKSFAGNFTDLVHLAFNPVDKNLYYLTNFDQISKFVYGGNQPPTAVIDADKTFGPGPLTVIFDGRASKDPENSALTYSWDFGDGTPVSSLVSPIHTFTATGPQAYSVTLMVTDIGGSTAQSTQLISVNNTKPVIESTSLDSLTTIESNATTVLNLSALVTDAEHTGDQLSFSWVASLMHNDHGHKQAPLITPTASVTLAALGECNKAETFWYRITLTVTDEAGLSATTFRDIYPNCDGSTQTITFASIPDQLKTQAPFRPAVTASSGLPVTLYVVGGPAFMENGKVRLTGDLGVVTVRATQAGNATFNPARAVEQTFTVVATLPAPTDSADLSLELVFESQVAVVNQPLSVSLVLRNDGPSFATGVQLLSRLPAELTFVSSSDFSHDSGVVSAIINRSMAPGDTVVRSMLLNPTQSGTYLLAAQVNASDVFDPDSQPASGTGDGQDDMGMAIVSTSERSTKVFVSPNPDQVPLPAVLSNQPMPEAGKIDLSLQIVASNRAPQPNQVVSLTFIVSNQGSVPALNVVVRDTLQGLAFVQGQGPNAIVSVSSSGGYTILTGSLTSVAPGESERIVIDVLVTGSGRLVNAAEIWSVGVPERTNPLDTDSSPGNGVYNGEDDTAWIDLRVNDQ